MCRRRQCPRFSGGRAVTARITRTERRAAEIEYQRPLTVHLLRKLLAEVDLLGLPDTSEVVQRDGLSGIGGAA